jgi:hypothetical protein
MNVHVDIDVTIIKLFKFVKLPKYKSLGSHNTRSTRVFGLKSPGYILQWVNKTFYYENISCKCLLE